jgi:hypothetical protein
MINTYTFDPDFKPFCCTPGLGCSDAEADWNQSVVPSRTPIRLRF